MNINDAQRAMRSNPAEAARLVAELAKVLRSARERAEIALAQGGELRHALRDMVRTYATVHGRTAGAQVAAFAGDELFASLMLLATGINITE